MRVQGAVNRNTPGRRRELLSAALEVFTERGFKGATMDEIVERAGASKGSVYHHFRSKFAMGAALYADALEELHLLLLRGLFTAKDTRAGIAGFVEAYLDWHGGRLDVASFMRDFGGSGGVEAYDEEVNGRIRKFRADLMSWIDARVRSGELRRMPESLVVAILSGPARDFLRLWRPDLDPEGFVAARRILPEAAWQALRAEDALDRAREGATPIIRLNRLKRNGSRER